ncbi:zinc finger, CCHC-type containing protein [Tanacetum coccineum]|uniref:Zinc finger, CCHC-type containing protein n=1 Tax=Tanacetum coccineum TaxID=301880 RepID=A0ABQ4Z5H1_9ASTR
MHLLLSSMSVVYVLTTPIPDDGDDATVDQLRKRAKWDNDDYVCRGLILNGGKVGNKANGSGINGLVDGSTNSLKGQNMFNKSFQVYYITYVSEAYFVQDDDVAWWVDSGATVHVCKDRSRFKTHESLNDGSILYIGNESTALVHGRGYVDLKFSSGKIVLLFNVLHVPNIRKNLVSSSVLNNYDYKQVIESNKFVLSKHDRESREIILMKLLVTIGETRNLANYAQRVMRGVCINRSVGQCVERSLLRSEKAETKDSVWSEKPRIDRCRIFIGYAEPFQGPFRQKNIGGPVVPKDGTRDEVPDQHLLLFNVENDPNFDDDKSGIDYFDTYAPVARISTIKLLIAMASIHNLIIHQMDVKTTFLNGDLEEEVYINQPQGFIMSGNENKVCKLIKSLYGLKQAPKQWHQKFDEVVLSNGYLLNQADKCFRLTLTLEFLSSKFSMKDMGEADVILGIRIKHESNGIAISQSHYIEKVLKKFNYFDCTLVSTPMDTSEKLMPNNGQAVSQLEYSRVIGCLMYAMTCTRPDIAFAVGKLSMYTSNPGTQHWQAIQRVLKYLKKTMDYSLTYTGYPSVFEGYTDASWISNTEDNSSTSGWVFLLGGGAISWASKKQTCITGSTMESEFVALVAAGKEAEWHSMIRELITNGVISIEFVRSQQNLVDHLTKGLAKDLVIKSAEGSMDFGSYNIYELDMDTRLV